MTAPARYRIRFGGHLDAAWSEWCAGLTVSPEPDGTTTLTGTLPDQAALYGLLSRLRDLGAPLLAVERLPDPNRPPAVPTGGANRLHGRAAESAARAAHDDHTTRGAGAGAGTGADAGAAGRHRKG